MRNNIWFISRCPYGESLMGRELHTVGLNLLDFSASHTAYCFLVCIGLFLVSWRTWKCLMQAYGRNCWRAAFACCVMTILIWSALFTSFQPPDPYWISELSVMCIVCSGLKMIDFLIWQDDAPYDFPFSGLLLDYALVLRPETLQHKPGQRHPTGRTLAMRIIDALRPLSWAIFQMCGCEALNAVLMQHTRADVLDAHYLYTCLLAVTLASALYLHLSYFFYSMVAVGVILLDHDPLAEWPPLFNSPWLSSSPSDFWNRRWHQMFRNGFVRLAFQPTKKALLLLLGTHSDSFRTPCASRDALADAAAVLKDKQSGQKGVLPRQRRKSQRQEDVCSVRQLCPPLAKPLSSVSSAALQILPTLSVFVFSGVLHEFLLLIFFGAPTGHQLAFFMVHAAALLVQRLMRRVYPEGQAGEMKGINGSAASTKLYATKFACILAWNAFLFLTTPLFMRPWFLYDYHRELRVLVPGPIHYFVRHALT